MERVNGTPVTIISDVCRGKKEIAKLRFERDCAEVVYKSAQEAINSYKLQIRILDAQIQHGPVLLPLLCQWLWGSPQPP